MGKIAHPRGKIIGNVAGFLRIYQKDIKSTVEVGGVKKEKTTGTTISIYHRKKLVKDGFKSKEAAIAAAQEMAKTRDISYK